jgi:hypothetical protein
MIGLEWRTTMCLRTVSLLVVAQTPPEVGKMRMPPEIQAVKVKAYSNLGSSPQCKLRVFLNMLSGYWDLEVA